MSPGTGVASCAGSVLAGRAALQAGRGRSWLTTLAMVLIVGGASQCVAEEALSADGVVFRDSAPVGDEELAQVHGTGRIDSGARLRIDVAVILWDEQPKAKPAPTPPTDSAASRTEHTSTSVR